MTILFWILVGIIFYTYFGYTIILMVFGFMLKNSKSNAINQKDLPEITHIIAAFNEADIVGQKLQNCRNLNYPENKVTNLWITDGSTDNSPDLLRQSQDITLLHKPERKGKTAALNRAMQHVTTPIVVFSDANTLLSPETLNEIIDLFADENIGCVAGEKQVVSNKSDVASASGEGQYWGYESLIKGLESKFGSTMGAVGELYAIRTALFSPPNANTILDDFVVSLNIAEKGYKIQYAPMAVAQENSSLNIHEEMKRKVRIAAGGFQVLFEHPNLLNLFKHPKLTFQYISHKVLRWLAVPICLPTLFFINMAIVATKPDFNIYFFSWILQLLFYFFALFGHWLRNTPVRLKAFFLPYYFVLANYAQIAGLFRYAHGAQNAAWDKAKRKTN